MGHGIVNYCTIRSSTSVHNVYYLNKIERFGEVFVHSFYILDFPNVHITGFLWTYGLWNSSLYAVFFSLESHFKHFYTEF